MFSNFLHRFRNLCRRRVVFFNILQRIKCIGTNGCNSIFYDNFFNVFSAVSPGNKKRILKIAHVSFSGNGKHPFTKYPGKIIPNPARINLVPILQRFIICECISRISGLYFGRLLVFIQLVITVLFFLVNKKKLSIHIIGCTV